MKRATLKHMGKQGRSFPVIVGTVGVALLMLLEPAGYSSGRRLRVGWGGGEKMTYAIRVVGVDGGRAALSIGHAGRNDTLWVRARGETVPAIAAMFAARAEVAAKITLNGLRPLETRRQQVIGRRERSIHTRYSGAITRQHVTTASRQQRRMRRTPRRTMDWTSLLLQLRTIPLRKGLNRQYFIVSDAALFRLDAKVATKERIYTDLGPITAWRIEGQALRVHDNGRPARGRRSRSVTLWVSADKRRIPVQLRGQSDFGWITMTINSYQPPEKKARVQI